MIEHAGRKADLKRPVWRLCNEACTRSRGDQIDIAGATQILFSGRKTTGARGGREMDDDPVLADRFEGIRIRLRSRRCGDAAGG
jgi:hypothetical protein